MGQLYRTQILLERSQHEELHRLAKAEGRSVSELVRAVVGKYIEEHTDEARLQRQLAVLDELAELREKIRAEHGEISEEVLFGFREEREEELWQRMLGEESETW